jgi:hypothetical protein
MQHYLGKQRSETKAAEDINEEKQEVADVRNALWLWLAGQDAAE